MDPRKSSLMMALIGGISALYSITFILMSKMVHITKPPVLPKLNRTGPDLQVAWFGGYLFDQFGHFLLEGISRCLHPEVSASKDPIVFISGMNDKPVKAYMKDVFVRIGINPDRIRVVNEMTTVGTLRVVSPAFEIRGIVYPEAYKHVLQAAGGGSASKGIVYLSRSKLHRRRKIEHENRLEQELRQKFEAEVIHPEELPLSNQIATFEESSLVVGCEGSAFHLLPFTNSDVNIAIISNDLPIITYLLCDELFGGNTCYIQAVREDSESDRNHWKVDVSKVISAIEYLHR